jgi:tRNA dimethylallyltransferase
MNSNAASDVAELRIICGPTAAGKSALALELAARHGATIISADSRQIYRRFDIGTAKPTRDEQARVPHRGIDIAEPSDGRPPAGQSTPTDG